MADAEYVKDRLATVADPVFLLETLFADAPVALAIAHADGRCVVVNRAFRELFGAAPPVDYNVFQDEMVIEQGLLPYVQRAFAGEHIVVPAFWFEPVRPESLAGARVAIEVSMTPLADRGGAIGHVALCYKDVTAAHELERVRQREEQNARIRDANRARTELLAAMSHELRTPLTTIIGFAELMFYGRVTPDSPEHHEFLGDILASGRQLLRMVDNVLDLADVEAGKLEFRPEPVVVESVIAEVTSVLRTLSLQKRIRIQVEADRAVEIVVTDAMRFKQVLYNYLSNALKFTPEGGCIVVRTRAESPELFRLEVEDSGVGIAPDRLPRLFLDFDHAATGALKHGTGLGLVLTRRIVEAQGGSVGVRSSLGQGSVFHAVLPRQPPASPARGAAPARDEPA